MRSVVIAVVLAASATAAAGKCPSLAKLKKAASATRHRDWKMSL